MKQKNNRSYDFPLIISNFSIQGSPKEVVSYGSGHIHDTFRVINNTEHFPDYLLQRINHSIFNNIPALTDNIFLVTNHLKEKLRGVSNAEPEKMVLTLIPTKDGLGYYKDEAGNFWRTYYYLKGTRSYDVVSSIQQAYEGGKAFGKFQTLLSDLNPKSLHETIPNFHDVENRYKLFQKAMDDNPKDRKKSVLAEIEFVNSRIALMSTINNLARSGKLPLRTTHNDTKFNNVLLDSNDKAQCVIDLDTVMAGYVAYDFGDAVRTIVNKAPEDEKDLDKITVDMDLFKGFTEGFLEEASVFLTNEELNSLSYGVLLLPFIMGLRFLTDYIEGDVYYKINFPEHNIYRARAQFQLVKRLEAKFETIQEIISRTAKSKVKFNDDE